MSEFCWWLCFEVSVLLLYRVCRWTGWCQSSVGGCVLRYRCCYCIECVGGLAGVRVLLVVVFSAAGVVPVAMFPLSVPPWWPVARRPPRELQTRDQILFPRGDTSRSVIRVIEKLVPCQAPGVIGSVLRLVSLVSDWYPVRHLAS